MNKNILQKFATEARRELRDKVINKAFEYGIKEDDKETVEGESSDSIVLNGKILDRTQKEQRRKIKEKIEYLNEQGSNGFDIIVEEVAYAWFNRLIAIRFLEVNRYIKTRAVSSEEGNNIPDIVTEALDVNFRNVKLDEDYIRKLKLSGDADATQNLFKYMIISQCNELHDSLPFMFEKISDYTELLFPDGLLDENSFVRKMTDTEYIPEEDWEEVEIIGWLYQYYIAEEKDRVIKAKKKYKKEEIPFATQLFTPKWIVKYMVQNSLGRYWIESHPEDDELKKEWEFYLENPEKEDDFEEKIAPYINKEMKVEDIKCFDPACGSGHILVYMFEVLYEIYSRVGYEAREIPKLIIENNLYGLDIDDRAYQLACFAVVMKGASYDKMLLRRIEKEKQETGKYIKFNIASIQETNNLNDIDIAYIAGERSGKNFDKTKTFLDTFYNAKFYGSLIKLEEFDNVFFEGRLKAIKDNPVYDIELQSSRVKNIDELLNLLITQSHIMSETYDILVTNPPYIGYKYMNSEQNNYLSQYYEDVKTDLFSAFIKYGFSKCKSNGQLGFMTPNVWMFISSYEKLREYIVKFKDISSLVQLSTTGFSDATVHIAAITLRNYKSNRVGNFVRLSDFTGVENQPLKVMEATTQNKNYKYYKSIDFFKKVPSFCFAYWLSDKFIKIFSENSTLNSVSDIVKGLDTCDNNKYVRLWSEINFLSIGFNRSNCSETYGYEKWFPYCKGGEYRKWYGNYENVVLWQNDGEIVRNIRDSSGRIKSRPQNTRFYFKKGITWSAVTSSKISMREMSDSIFGCGGLGLFAEEDRHYTILALVNSKLCFEILKFLNPTLNFQVGDIKKIPISINNARVSNIETLVKQNIQISKNDWDSFESSWDFKIHPLVVYSKNNNIRYSFEIWNEYKLEQFKMLKNNEEEINQILIDIYGIHNEVDPNVEDKDVTIHIANRESDIKSFISYAIGCMLGRYSLDQEGLIYAGGEFDSSKYTTFKADEDNIIPILDENYFEDDIANRFIEFVQVTFGEESLNENLDYIAETLVKKSGESSKDTIRRYFLNDFYKDHVQTYKKRPIYWLVTSGKQKAFNALIYMHRYDKNTLSRIRTDYVHPLQNKLEVEKSRAEEDLSFATKASERNPINRKITNIEKQIDELKKFEELLHDYADKQIEIDLDDGVVHNYGLFKGLLGKI